MEGEGRERKDEARGEGSEGTVREEEGREGNGLEGREKSDEV